MSGKGSKARPYSVSKTQFDENWDRIFSKGNELTHDTVDLTPLREVAYDGMWKHSCTMTMEVMWIGKDETCNMCGAWEEDGDDVPLSLQ